MKSKEEIEEYLGFKLESNVERHIVTYGEDYIGDTERYMPIAGEKIIDDKREYEYVKVISEESKNALQKLLKDSMENGDIETAATCHSILMEESDFYRNHPNAIGGLDLEQIIELRKYEQEQNARVQEETRIQVEKEAQAKAEETRIKAEQEAKERAEEQARIQAEKEEQAKAEEAAKIKEEQEAQARGKEEARIQEEQEAQAKAEEEARVQEEQEAQTKAKEEVRKQAEQEAKDKKRQAVIDKDIEEYEQYEELITRKPELDKLLDELKYEDFSAEIHGHTSEKMQKLLNNMKMLPEDERKIIVQQYNKHANLLINEHGEFLREEKIADILQPKEETKANQIVSEVRENELSSSEEKAAETSIRTETSVEIDDNSMMEAHLEYMRNHQTQQTSKTVENYWNEIHSQNAKLYEQHQPEKIKPREESIRDEVGDKKDIESNMQMQERQPPTVDLWTNRFSNYYSAIDRVSQNVKSKFVEMKSNIIKAISEKLTERTNHRQVNTQKQDTNER